MYQQVKVKTAELFNSPTARAVFVIGTIVIAALAGGAPNDHGGAP